MKKIGMFIVFALITLSVTGQMDRSVRPAPAPATLLKLEKAKSFELENGLKVFVVENRKLPQIYFSLFFDFDRVFEGEFAGLSDLTGQLLRTATTTRTKKQIDDEIDYIGASLTTDARQLSASGLSRNAEKITELLADVVLNARFEKEHFERAKKQTTSGLMAARNNPNQIASRVSNTLFFGINHPYGLNPTEKSVEKVTLEAIETFYKTYYKPGVAYLAIVGDMSVDQARGLVTKYFSSWVNAPVPRQTYPAVRRPAETKVALVDRPSAVQSVISLGFPVELKPGSEFAIKGRVMNNILGGSTSRLFNNLREQHGFTYGAYSKLNSDKLMGSFIATADVRNIATDSAVHEILYEINRIRTEAVPLDELRLYKNELSGNFALSLENPQTIASFALNTARFQLPENYYDTYLEQVAAITPEDILASANNLLFPENAHILIVGKAADVAGQMKKFSKSGKITYLNEDGVEYDPDKQLLPPPANLSARQVIDRYLEVRGGKKKLQGIKDLTMKASATMQGMSINFDTYRKAPNKIKVEVGASGMVFSKQIFDGARGKVSSMMGSEELQGEKLEEMKFQAIMNPEIDYEKKAIKHQLLGIEKVNGAQAYKVEQTNPNGSSQFNYFDVTSGLLLQSVTPSGTTVYEDYRAVSGIKFPFRIMQQAGPQTIDLTVNSIKINSKLGDDIFKIE